MVVNIKSDILQEGQSLKEDNNKYKYTTLKGNAISEDLSLRLTNELYEYANENVIKKVKRFISN